MSHPHEKEQMSTSMTRTRSLSPVFIIAIFAATIMLVVNAVKRAGIALSPVTQLAAPLAQLLAVGLVVGIFAATPAVRGRLGTLGAVLCAASLVLLVGVEFTVSSISFLLGTLLFFTALWRVAGSPKFAILLAVASSVSIALRTVFPEVVLQGGLGSLAGAVAMLAFWLIRSRRTQAASLRSSEAAAS
jgi:hypothetical protein